MSSRRRVNVHTLIAQEQAQEQQEEQPLQPESSHTEDNTTVQSDTVKPLKRQTSKMVQSDIATPVKTEEKLVTKISVYLEDEPYIEKLDSLKKQYRKRTKKGTDYNKILRILINKATIEDLL